MNWRIVTDSSCDYVLDQELPENIKISKVPFIITIGEKDYIDNEDLNVDEMINDMESCVEASHTACPSPETWAEEFKKDDYTIAITISANLSGSYNSAMLAKNIVEETYHEKKVYVLNSKSAGSVLSMYLETAIELIKEGKSFDEVVEFLEKSMEDKHTIFALASFSNLVKNGRVGKVAGFLAKVLKIWGIGIASPEGTIVVKKKLRGIKNVIKAFIEDMKENNFIGKYVIISHCGNHELATKLKEALIETLEKVKVKILSTRGLCSFYAERKGLIVSY